MRKIRNVVTLALAATLIIGTIPFGSSVVSAETEAITPVIVDTNEIGENIAINGDFETGEFTSKQQSYKLDNGTEKTQIITDENNKYLVIAPRDSDLPSGKTSYAFKQTITGLDINFEYYLSFKFKTAVTKSDWTFLVGLFNNADLLGSNPNPSTWGYVTPISSAVSTGGAAYITNNADVGGIISDVTSTEWQTVKIRFKPTAAWTNLVFTSYIAAIGELFVDNITVVKVNNQNNLIYNGDLESPVINNDFGFNAGTANRSGYTPASMPIVVSTDISGGNGASSLFIPGYTYVAQQISGLENGKTYRYSYNIKFVSAGNGGWSLFSGLQKFYTAGNLQSDPNGFVTGSYALSSGITRQNDYGGTLCYTNGGVWYTVTETFVATQSSLNLYVLNWYGKDCYMDDFALVEVTENQYLLNGDFEDGNSYGFTTNNAKIVTAESVGANGNFALYLPNNGTKSEAWQMVTGLTAGNNYYLTYRVRLATLATGWTLFADIRNSRPTKLTNPSASGITRSSVNITDGFNFAYDANYGYIISNGNSYSTEWQTIVVPFTASYGTAYVNLLHFSSNVPDIYIDDVSVIDNTGVYMTNGSFSNGTTDYALQEGTACSIVENYDELHENVLVEPKSASSTPSERRFYKAVLGLTVGETYSMTFDMKMDNYENPGVMDWIGLAGVSTVKPIMNNNSNHLYNVTQPAVSSFFCQSSSGSLNKNSVGDYGYIQYNGSTDWLTYEVRFVAESDTAYFYLENNYGKADLIVDNIAIEAADPLTGQINCTPSEETEETTSVMLIGNSFSQDAMREIQGVIDAGGVDFRLAMFGKGAKDCNYFYNQYSVGDNQMEFWYAEKGKTDQTLIQLSGTGFNEAFDFLNWDYVVVQATTGGSDILSANYDLTSINRFLSVIRTELPNAQIILYVPWAYTQDYITEHDNGYNTISEQIAAYNDYSTYITLQTGCQVISMLSAIENSRNINGIGESGVTRDGFHMNALGSTTLALKFYEYFTGNDVRTLNYTKTYFPYDQYTSNYTGDLGTSITDAQLLAIKAGVHATFVNYIKGDSNHDNFVDVKDLVREKKHLADNAVSIDDVAGDLDLNGVIDGQDLAALRKLLMNN